MATQFTTHDQWDHFAAQIATQFAELPDSKQAALDFMLAEGSHYGYKNILLALAGRMPKAVANGVDVDEFIARSP